MIAEMIREIEHRARTERKTGDRAYNNGAKRIRENGYENVAGEADVVYWCGCNGYE